MEDYTKMYDIVLNHLTTCDDLKKYNPKAIKDSVDLAINTVHNEELQAFNIKTRNNESGYCSQCGKCCQTHNIILRLEDINNLYGHVDLKNNLTRHEDYFKFVDKPCRYQSSDGRCGCYQHRPITCRNHPLTNHQGTPRIMRDTDCDFCIQFFIDKSISLLTKKPFK